MMVLVSTLERLTRRESDSQTPYINAFQALATRDYFFCNSYITHHFTVSVCVL
jgi:hypothetical protein